MKKKLTKSQIRQQNARKDYEEFGLTVKEIADKYGYKQHTLRGYIHRHNWQQDLSKIKENTIKHLSIIIHEDIDILKDNLFNPDSTAGEVEEIQKLATIMMATAKGNVSVVKQTFFDKDGVLIEKVREVQTIKPDAKCGQFYLELSEKLATMVDIGEFETDAELEERYKRYEENLKKQQEEFENRIIDE